MDDGLTALARLLHESYDFVIVGRELKELNGIALMAALRFAQPHNQNIPAILVGSKRGSIPDQARFSATLSRDQKLAENLIAVMRTMLPASSR